MLFGRKQQSIAHGSAGWGRPPKELLCPVTKPLPPGAFFLGIEKQRYIALPRELSLRHTLCIGGSGTGKSRGYYLPNAALAHNTSLLCTDPKSELWNYTSGYHPSAVRFAPTEPGQSQCLNWIPLCASARVSELCARAIVESGQTGNTEQAWLDLEAALLSALFSHTATLPEPTPLSAYKFFTRTPQEKLIEILLASPSDAAVEQGIIFQQTSERMRGNIVPVLAAKLQFMRDEAIARFTSASHFAPSFGRLKREPCAIYWCMSESDIIRLRPLTSLFFSLAYDQLAGEDIPDGEPQIPVLCLLDEFANIGVIPQFPSKLTLARGRGIGFSLGIQSFSQLEAAYGKANSQTIITNCATKIALSSLDVETAEYISRALGETTIITKKKNRHRKWFLWQPTSSTLSIAEHRRPLLSSDEVRRTDTDKAIVLTGNLRPMLLPKYFYNALPRTGKTAGVGEARTIEVPFLPATKKRLELPAIPSELFSHLRML